MLKRIRTFIVTCLMMASLSGAALANGAPEVVEFPRQRPVPEHKAPRDLGSFVAKNSTLPEVAAALIDVRTGEILETHRADAPMTPASVTKVVTTLYGFDRLGPDYSFKTRLRITGPVLGGIVQGDLVLEGGGDPVLDTDELATMADQLRDAGILGVTGRYLYDDDLLPDIFQIHDNQPEFVVYNPAISGLNANFNRVFFEWNLGAVEDALTLRGRAANNRPRSNVVSIEQVSRGAPVFDYVEDLGRDHWTVAADALKKPGGRWLPVREPGAYTADLFRTLARERGIVLPPANDGVSPPDGRVVAQFVRRPLRLVCRGMLHFSTNLTAEIIGMTARQAKPADLAQSAGAMTDWVHATFGARAMKFADHSGLNPANEMSAADMAFVMSVAARQGTLDGILRRYFVAAKAGNGEAIPGVDVRAKTGSLNFVRGLSGQIKGRNGRHLAFAIFSRDAAKRTAADHGIERPPGARTFANRAKTVEQALLRRWIGRYAQ